MLTESSRALRVSDEERATFLPWLFGAGAAVQGEALVYAWAAHVSSDYKGAVWSYWKTPSGSSGFLAPEGLGRVVVDCGLPAQSLISDEALGIAVTLLALKDMAAEADADVVGLRLRYKVLAEYAARHVEARSILELAG